MQTGNEFQLVLRRGLIGFSLGLAFALMAYGFLPEVPAGEWAWLIRGFISLVIGSIVFGLAWFVTVASVMKEMM